ncbi:hypothetical protein J6590_067242 [Homalodisca vitripennis]|nr:hypothetical protein J6590_067242 [Homalodisca vitripennis]
MLTVAVHNMLTCISRRLGEYRASHSKYEHVVQCCCSQHAHVNIEEAKESTEPVTRNMNM